MDLLPKSVLRLVETGNNLVGRVRLHFTETRHRFGPVGGATPDRFRRTGCVFHIFIYTMI